MTYAIKEIFKTLQGEGGQAGRAAVFCRFAGCNLWSGREEDRARAICQFCDTDFVGINGTGGGRFASPQELAREIEKTWGTGRNRRFVVLTGGEPLLQVDTSVLTSLKMHGFEIALETNGTIAVPEGVSWICVSPKAGSKLIQKSGHELKLVFPQPQAMPHLYEKLNFEHFFLQPMDGPDLKRNTECAIEYCLRNPLWRLSLQTHKLIGIP